MVIVGCFVMLRVLVIDELLVCRNGLVVFFRVMVVGSVGWLVVCN